MKKIVFPILALMLVVSVFTSCKKCVTCSIERLDGTVDAEYDQFCGTSDEVDEFKKELQNKSNSVIGDDGIVICTND